MPFQTSTNHYQISKYIVDATATDSCYNTIQAAITAANTAGGGTVYIRPGTYTENLTLYDGVDLWGAVGVADTGTCIINGIHTPPAAGTLTIRNIALQSATDIFNSAAAGTTLLIIMDCQIRVTNGYVFNLPNWTGTFVYFDVGSNSTNDGVINNTGGATVFMTDATIGNGTGNTMTVSGNCTFFNIHFQCPITIQGTGNTTINGGCWFDHTLTTAATATISISNSYFDTAANAAITHGSANPITLSDVTIDSTANPCITGAGAGNLVLGSVTYLNNTAIAGTITKSFATRLETGILKLDDTTAGVLTATAGVVTGISPLTVGLGGTGVATITDHALIVGSAAAAVTEIGPLTNGQLVIGSTGADPVAATLTNGANITWTGGAGTLQGDLTGTTDHAIQLGNATGSLTSLGVATNGQLPIGSTGADPVLASLTAPATGVTITGGAGTITFALANDIGAIEALGTTGVASRTAADTWATSSITQNAILYGSATEGLTNLGPLTNGQLVIGSTGAAPVAAVLTSTDSSVTITNGAGSIDLSAVGGLTYAEETGATKTIVNDYEYGANRGGGVAFALPGTAAIGKRFAITGIAGLWSITQGAGQSIAFGAFSTTVGAGGSLVATNAGDCVHCTCIVANTTWRVTSSIGNLTVN